MNKALLQDLLDQMQEQADAAANDYRRVGTGTPLDDLNASEKSELLADIQTTKTHAAGESAKTGDRRGGTSELSKADQNIFIPRSPELSNLQSAIEHYFLEHRPGVVETPSPDDRRSGGPVPVAGSQLTIAPDYLEGRRILGPFEQTDIGWINSLFAKGIRRFRRKHPFVDRPARGAPISLPDQKVRMIVFGDWGSGIPRALKVEQRIRKEMDDGLANGLQLHVVHLGDVYYSGWDYEYSQRFLVNWPVAADEAEKIGSFTLNGNHDMYSGGYAYYQTALADSRFDHWQGQSSLFHLANKYWQIFGLDTSHDDNDLKGDQADWVRSAASKKLKTILLSHHQYCSSYEAKDISRNLVRKIDPVLKELDVAAWLWGHEHRCMTYKDVPGIRFPRCIGHAGVPVYQTHDLGGPTPKPGEWEYRDYIDGGLELWAKFGFIVLDFHLDKIAVRYINEDGGDDRKEIIE
ncbi:MAG TPA: metallophosphoesterase [Candidatus Angelobacter sp.]